MRRDDVFNRIEARCVSGEHGPEPYLSIFVDDVPLDALLGNEAEGLVSALLGWFHSAEDCEIPWQRILPDDGCTGYAPILICPDDLDLKCSVVIAEVVAERAVILWSRLGFDATEQGAVGSIVRWHPDWGPYRFQREQYENCLAAFRTASGP